MSSAYMMTSDNKEFKKIGPRWLPCGTPEVTRKMSEKQLLKLTFWDQSTKYDLNHVTKCWSKPIKVNFFNRSWSKALLKSVYITSVCNPFPKASKVLVWTERPFWLADITWESENDSCEAIIFSKSSGIELILAIHL